MKIRVNLKELYSRRHFGKSVLLMQSYSMNTVTVWIYGIKGTNTCSRRCILNSIWQREIKCDHKEINRFKLDLLEQTRL